MNRKVLWLAASLVFLLAVPAGADTGGTVSPADTAWLLVSTALVMLMTPGLALFYGGMLRRKNVLSTIMQSFFIICLIGVEWVLWGYALSFGPDLGGVVGSLDRLGISLSGLEPRDTVPGFAFIMFQGMFAIITVALISGAVAERMKFSTFFIFSLIWSTIVYNLLCHWVWGGGWLAKLGFLDFAGGAVVHISSGASALVAAILIGRRKCYPEKVVRPHNLTMTVLGTGLLWFGWFGFNAGSAITSGSLASLAFTNTFLSACAAGLVWVFIDWTRIGKPTVLGICSGAIAGLAGVTPAAGFISPNSAMIIGAVAAILCYYGVSVLKPRLGYDDTLDVFGIHGLSGTWGTLAVGLFATKAANSAGADGLFFGNPRQLLIQIVGIAAAWVLSVVVTYGVLKILDVVMKLRVSEEEEDIGLDLTQHSESAYTILE
ncbi:MAG: ammonium transporter [Proteobacteria bacterium]|nr:ammonium transporter [Pseudomonadota bacterium]